MEESVGLGLAQATQYVDSTMKSSERLLWSIHEPVCVLGMLLPYLGADSRYRLDGTGNLPAILSSAGIGHHLHHPAASPSLSTHPVIRASRPQVNCLPACWMTAAVRSLGLCQHPCSSRLGETLTSLANCIIACGVIYGGLSENKQWL